ncbi:hypothetical protein LAZ67_11003733 [Cordylochernes scorpioides]|uniref:Uncharacterized protein n=1 Tax=Cordylochernes scorpioides TaxID=51811 RepID=A0ABY6L0V4_9ARAC|nr:hypothetical protein LAZ67_11003733 [Cordylochernes scorpioides]
MDESIMSSSFLSPLNRTKVSSLYLETFDGICRGRSSSINESIQSIMYSTFLSPLNHTKVSSSLSLRILMVSAGED